MDIDICYTVIYEKRRSIAIKVEGGKVIVKAPKSADKVFISSVVTKHSGWILNRLNTPPNPSEKELAPDEIRRLRTSAKVYFENMADIFSNITGLKCGRIKITSGKQRLGSCSSDGNLCFSYRLMLYPEAAREYVVLHELAHIVEMNHSPAFYKFIEKFMPDYKERKKLLKQG